MLYFLSYNSQCEGDCTIEAQDGFFSNLDFGETLLLVMVIFPVAYLLYQGIKDRLGPQSK